MGHREISTTAWRVIALGLMALLVPSPATAEWVRGEVRLNLRTAPGADRRIITTIATGDQVRILEEGEDWTRVQIEDGREGWIPAGFLAEEAPAAVRLERQEAQVATLKEKLAETSSTAEALRSTNESLTQSNETLTAENQRLSGENHRLKAGARWPEWVAGASILVVGMLLGAIIQSWTGRRNAGRIRL
jgi:SH3 domain protein